MFFVDNSGHIFELPSYSRKPIGYEYEQNPYVFWINDNNDNSLLSINNYYARSIQILYEIEHIDDLSEVNVSDILDIDISLDSKIFSFIQSATFQEAISNAKSIIDYIDITNNRVSKLVSNNDDDIFVLKITESGKNYILIPIYVIGYATEAGSWTSNIMIHIKNTYLGTETWCPISVGGTFNSLYEPLVIHGKNMGVDLPKDILKALANTSYYNDKFNEELYNKKLKEYMLNYMAIKGECGNYNSAISSLKWFGYEGALTLYKLIETTNQAKQQFIRDYFDINTDIILAYRNFINTQYVSLQFRLNYENGERYRHHAGQWNTFWGEANPILVDLTNGLKLKETNEWLGIERGGNERYAYIDTYFKYSFNELSLKISCLAYYYQKYFLPLFIALKNISIEYKVYTNDTKLYGYAREHFSEATINTQRYLVNVIFNNGLDNNIRYVTHQYHYVDDKFNEFSIGVSLNDIYDIVDSLDRLSDDTKKEAKEIISVAFKDIDIIKSTSIVEIDNLDYNIRADIIDAIYDECNKEYYLVNDTCVTLPIEFKKNEGMNVEYYNVTLMLKEKESDTVLYTSKFKFLQNESYKYNSFVIYPTMLEQMSKSINRYINRTYIICLFVNDSWYSYEFVIKAAEFNIEVGKLEYRYWDNDINLFNAAYRKKLKEMQEENPDEENKPTVVVQFNDYGYVSALDSFDPDYKDNITQYGGNEPVRLDITPYIEDYDFFDDPTKVLSRFSQIKEIKDGKVYFNTHMWFPEFINIDNINFGTEYRKLREENVESIYLASIEKLIEKYREKIYIVNNYKYLNNVHVYSLYKVEELPFEEMQDILMFKDDIHVRCNRVLFEKVKSKYRLLENKTKYTVENTFNIVGMHKESKYVNTTTFGNLTSTEDGIDSYVYTDNPYTDIPDIEGKSDPSLIEGNAWYYIIKRKLNYDIDSSNPNAENLFEYYDKGDLVELGYCVYKTPEDFANNRYDYKSFDEKIYVDGNYYIYKENNLEHTLIYENSFVKKSASKYKNDIIYYYDEFTDNDPLSSTKLISDNDDVYIKIVFKYYRKEKVLNIFGYYNNLSCENFVLIDNDTAKCTVTVKDSRTEDGEYQIGNIVLHKSKFYQYFIGDGEDTTIDFSKLYADATSLAYLQNPSFYWAELDADDNIIYNDIDALDIDMIHGDEFGSEEELKNAIMEDGIITYNNYLCKDYTGLKGKYLLKCDYGSGSSSDNAKVIMRTYDEEDNITGTFDSSINDEYGGKIVELDGTEAKVTLFFVINDSAEIDCVITPHLYKYDTKNVDIDYDYDLTDNDLVTLYKKFFYNKYTISLLANGEEEILRNIWDSMLDFKDNSLYDTYLMHGYKDNHHTESRKCLNCGHHLWANETICPHCNSTSIYPGDPQSWYIVFISKDTCDKFNNVKSLFTYPETIEYTFGDETYMLKHMATKNIFLINRMRFTSSNNINHFDKDEMIVAYLKNNSMLPVNLDMHTKWNITPLSFGMNSGLKIFGNSNAAVLSIPKNDNVYNRGYYNIEVQYSLDRKTLNYQNCKKKILIK